jgi:hypothetical protein
MSEPALSDEQRSVDTRLAREAVSCLPKNWGSARVNITRDPDQAARDRFRVSIEPKNGETGVAFATDELLSVARELFMLHDRRHTDLVQAVYDFNRVQNKWKFTAEFVYRNATDSQKI